MRSMPLPLSSGNPLLDRRLAWARGSLDKGEAAAAAALLAEIVAEAPNFLAAWFALGEAHAQAGALNEAAAAFRRALSLDPADRLGASLRLTRLGAEPAPMPPAYVRALFDQYAGRFERELGHLSYRGPAVLAAAIDTVAGTARRFDRVLDIGCGTGLMGTAIRPRAGALVGVDLSPAMLAEARAKGLYDRLLAADLVEFLAAEAGAFDLIVAADVLVYIPDLAPVLAVAARVLAPDGLFAFTLEHSEGEPALGAGLRYAHGTVHLREAAAAAGLSVRHLAPVSTRSEKGRPVASLVAVLSRGRTTGSRQGR
jgi:predicted TPR repeat methyltransferase